MLENTFKTPFPRDALLSVIGGAASYIYSETLAPFELIACSVLAACATSCQPHINVRWREHGYSPVSLYIVNEGETGERKTGIDNIAHAPFFEFDKKQKELRSDAAKDYSIKIAVWNAKEKQLIRTISRLHAKGECTDDEESRLEYLQSVKPELTKLPDFFVENLTSPALAKHLDAVYPYCALLSGEGDTVFNGGALQDVGLLNKLWEAGSWKSDRISRGRIELIDVRFTFFIQVQPSILEGYLKRQGVRFHGSGLSSRFLFASPESQQGKRFSTFDEKRPQDIEAYYRRIQELLDRCTGPVIAKPGVLELSDAASNLLVWFQSEIEKELGEDGRFYRMRGPASKITENCARIAAILHTMENIEGPITVDVLKNAIKLSAWFLNQYRNRFCPLSERELDIKFIDEFLTTKIAPKFATKRVIVGSQLQGLTPRPYRLQIDRLFPILKVLESMGRLKIWGDKGTQWRVVLSEWSPSQVAQEPAPAPASLNSSTPGYLIKWNQKPHQEAPLEDETKPGGYELWPNTFLR